MKKEKYDNRWQGKSWEWFGLSYSSWLTLPRIVLQSMPTKWQEKFFSLLDEVEETIELPNYTRLKTVVTTTKYGKFVKTEMPSYRHNMLKLKR